MSSKKGLDLAGKTKVSSLRHPLPNEPSVSHSQVISQHDDVAASRHEGHAQARHSPVSAERRSRQAVPWSSAGDASCEGDGSWQALSAARQCRLYGVTYGAQLPRQSSLVWLACECYVLHIYIGSQARHVFACMHQPPPRVQAIKDSILL